MKRKAWQLGTLTATLTIMACLLSGCAWSIGEHKEHGQPTRGQELLDLKKARDNGAMTEDEYQAQKRRVLGQ
jgi:hypothetical protein